ncbi:MAG: thioredoxin domain-containing protein, partial [Bacteroidota bacterium]|nr:thioredoxin domain-containing protein [Bacteroidota bacterium]
MKKLKSLWIKNCKIKNYDALSGIEDWEYFDADQALQLKYEPYNGEGIKICNDDIDKIKEYARKGNKLVLLDFYTTWCGPCKCLLNIHN